MKNLKIGAKILLGFGIVLAMLIVVAITSIIVNSSSVSNSTESGAISDFQTAANSMMDGYNEARTGANVIYVTSSDDAYKRVVDGLATSKNFIPQMKEMTKNAVISSFANEVDEIEVLITEWEKDVSTVQEYNTRLEVTKTENAPKGASATAAAQEAFETINKLVDRDISSSATVDALRKGHSMKDSTSQIIFNVSDIRRNATNLFQTFNTANIGTAFETADATYKIIDEIISNTESADVKTSLNEAKTTLTDYMAGISDFIKVCDESYLYVAEAEKLTTELTEKVNSLVAKLDVDMADAFKSTIDSANMGLVLSIVFSLVALVIGVFMALLIMTGITKPIGKMQNIIKIVGNTGRMRFSEAEVSDIKSAISKDEIGQSIEAFCIMMDRLVYVTGELERVSKGDLTVNVKAIGEDDTIGNAVIEMVDKLNMMFGEINQATVQVSSGSHQIAECAQALASGSTEQAASIEELSSSIAEIADKTNENAQQANKAASLSTSIKDNAQKGSAQMDNMMKAVNEINEASQNISKVIKVIDDIAFQTNILALNAAVEAARAGEAGKGFAVVADEVRNLAAKSAEAAKDTSSLIANSIEKAELGAKIANETAVSLNDIVAGINESTTIIGGIAETSEEQAVSVQQINTGIDQVAQVVQQNSATAEESAAASEELNSQSTLLSELVSQFKLKE